MTSVVRATGSAPLESNGNNVEYRFLVSDITTPNGAAPTDAEEPGRKKDDGAIDADYEVVN